MANDVTTNLIVKAKPEGFAKLRDEQGRINADVRKGTKEAAAGFKESSREVDKFAASLEKAVKAFAGLAQVNQLKSQIGDLNKEVTGLKRNLDDASKARGSFFQGFAQGAGVGEYIQRGPGMGRQILGRQLGQAVAAPGRMLGGAMFGGVQGLIGSMQNLPLGLGMAAVPIANAMGMAQRGLAFQQQVLQAAPLMGGAQAIDLAQARARNAPINMRRAQLARERAEGQAVSFAEVEQRRPGLASEQFWGSEHEEVADEIRRTRGDRAHEENIRRQRTATRRQARKAARMAMISGVARAGLEFGGMGKGEALGLASQLRGAAGGAGGVAQRDLRTAIAAQTAFGVDTGISGQFLRAGRRGGAVGARGRGMDAMTDAMSEGMRLGLEGSELVDYMRQMADGIRQFDQTGIPINTQSIGEIGTVFKAAGLEGARLTNVAGGVQRFGRGIAQRGPTGALDLMMLQAAGFQGGGTEGMLEAMMKLERGAGGAETAQVLQGLVKAGGGGAGSVFAVQRAMAGMGTQVSLAESQKLVRQVEAGELTPERMKEVIAAQTTGPGAKATTPEAVQAAAREMVNNLAPAVKRQSALTNRQIDIGTTMIKSMQSLESAMTSTAGIAEKLIGGDMAKMTGAIESIAKSLEDLAGEAGGGGGTAISDLVDYVLSSGMRTAT